MIDTEALVPHGEDSTVPRTPEGVHDPHRIPTAAEREKRYREGVTKRQTGRNVRLLPWLRMKKEYFRSLDSQARAEHLQNVKMMLRYFDADMYVEYNEAGQLVRLDDDGDFRYVIPVMNGHILESFMQMMKVRPEWVWTPVDRNNVDKVRLAAMCGELGPEELARLMQEDERQGETLCSLLTGDSHREIAWAVHPKSPKKVKRIRQKASEFETPGRRECIACKAEVPEGAAECPACGVTGVRQVAGGKGVRYDPETYEVELGENTVRIPHPMAMQSDLGVSHFDDSTYAIIHDTLFRHTASWDYKTLLSAEGSEGFSVEAQARAEVDRRAVVMDGLGGQRADRGLDQSRIERERHFWDVSEYGGMYCEVEEQLPNPVPDPARPGKMTDKIPAGTLWGDFFPKGAHVTYLGEEVIDIQPVEKRRRLIRVTYGKRPGSPVGTGAKLLALLNDIVNDDYNLYHKVKTTSAHPFTVVAGQSVKVLPDAGQFLRIDHLPPGVSDVRAVIAQYPGQSVAGMDATAQTIQQAMQFIQGTYTIGAGGAPDMQSFGGTATEVTARVEQASGRQSGPIGQVISADRETMLICLENIRDYSTPEQREELVRRFGPDVVREFFNCDFRREMNVAVKPNTDIPRSLALTQAGRLAFAQSAGQLLQFAAQYPWVMEFLEGLADSYGFPLSLGPSRSDRREAEYRLNKLRWIEEDVEGKKPGFVKADPKAAAVVMYEALARICGPFVQPAQAEPTPEEMAALAQLPPAEQQAAIDTLMQKAEMADAIRIFIQDHAVYMDVYKDEIFGERAKSYSAARVLVICRLWEDHFFAGITQEAKKAQIQAHLQATLAPPEPAAPEGPNPDEVAEDERMREEEGRTADRESAADEHERKMELEGMKGDHALALEAVRSKARGGQEESRA